MENQGEPLTNWMHWVQLQQDESIAVMRKMAVLMQDLSLKMEVLQSNRSDQIRGELMLSRTMHSKVVEMICLFLQGKMLRGGYTKQNANFVSTISRTINVFTLL